MKKNLLLFPLFASILLFNHTLSAQCINGFLPTGQRCGGTVQTAATFVRIVPDARSGAMGDVGIALTPEANSILYNASKLAMADKNGAYLSIIALGLAISTFYVAFFTFIKWFYFSRYAHE